MNELEENNTHATTGQAQNAQSFLFFLASVLGILLLGIVVVVQNTFARLLLLVVGAALLVFFVTLFKKERMPDSEELVTEEDTIPEENTEDCISTSPQQLTHTDEHSSSSGEKIYTPFELLIREALDSIPEEFHEQMDNLVILVEQEPDHQTLERTGVSAGQTLLGLYHGIPLTHIGYAHALYPEQITLFQGPIERYCQKDPKRIREQVRATLLHEIAHHFGIDHDEMPIWVK